VAFSADIFVKQGKLGDLAQIYLEEEFEEE